MLQKVILIRTGVSRKKVHKNDSKKCSQAKECLKLNEKGKKLQDFMIGNYAMALGANGAFFSMINYVLDQLKQYN